MSMGQNSAEQLHFDLLPAASSSAQSFRKAYETVQQPDQRADSADSTPAPPPSSRLSWLPRAVQGPPLVASQSSSSFWQDDGTFQCDWGALKSGEAFCSSVKAACAYCLSRALGGPSKLRAALLERLRLGAKAAIEEEVAHLIQSVNHTAAASAGNSGGGQPEAAAGATQQLMQHPALQAVAFLSVHERRLAIFEIWLDRWQVLSGGYQCTCGSTEAADEGLMRISSENATKRASELGKETHTEVTIEALRSQVAQLREQARNAQQEEEIAVAEARNLSTNLVKKQQQLLLATERVKALEMVRADPVVALMRRAQQQQASSSSGDGHVASQLERFRFIAEKCSRLANLGRLMQQDQVAQPLQNVLEIQRASWELLQGDGKPGEKADGRRETGLSLWGNLNELQTPHASLHSPRSQRARMSSYDASSLKPHERARGFKASGGNGGITGAGAESLGEQRNTTVAEGIRKGFALVGSVGRNEREDEARSSNDFGRSTARSVAAHNCRSLAEAESSKRRRAANEAEVSGWRSARPLLVGNADLDLDGDAIEHLTNNQAREDPSHVCHQKQKNYRRKAANSSSDGRSSEMSSF
ncbi:hypothetical protein Efla_004926 [Eimeria flavescens]